MSSPGKDDPVRLVYADADKGEAHEPLRQDDLGTLRSGPLGGRRVGADPGTG